jgi:hypothetical protein
MAGGFERVQKWYDVSARAWKPDAADHSVLRATFDTLPDGYHLLVGKNADDLDAFTSKIEVALLLGVSLTFVLAGVASVSVTRRTVGRIEAINTTSRSIMQSGLSKRIPLRGTRDEWDQLATLKTARRSVSPFRISYSRLPTR